MLSHNDPPSYTLVAVTNDPSIFKFVLKQQQQQQYQTSLNMFMNIKKKKKNFWLCVTEKPSFLNFLANERPP